MYIYTFKKPVYTHMSKHRKGMNPIILPPAMGK